MIDYRKFFTSLTDRLLRDGCVAIDNNGFFLVDEPYPSVWWGHFYLPREAAEAVEIFKEEKDINEISRLAEVHLLFYI